ncbi:hybrid sensor histidine kinase/response regulator [Aliikangiella sp. G2MR2-5]|uniref:hybrid sensor histidine kinase/response regulator n=1 Tax=Aliikangiella sp. G2MR2-5 TaxID=2788943 RepID=UPI001AEE38CF|nr:hybrid sensor histidine kinase/response regulator [Aliikangiella sp. G2MR2-5]
MKSACLCVKFLILILLSFAIAWKISASELRFKRLGTERGLPQNSITTLFKSKDGRLWLGTQNGLAWYDGYKFHVFSKTQGDPDSISDNFIWSITEDKYGKLWIGTRNGGLNRYDPTTNQFKSFRYDQQDPSSLRSDNIQSLLYDSQERLWVGTSGGGLSRFNFSSQSFEHYIHDKNNSNSIGGNHVKTIVEDKNNNLWIGLSTAPFINIPGKGFDYFEVDSKRFTHYQHDSTQANSISSNDVSSIYIDADQTLWIGTYLGGLNHFNPEKKSFTRFPVGNSSIKELPSKRVMQIIEADNDGLWLAVIRAGLVYFDKKDKTFTVHANNPLESTSLSNSDVISLLKTKNNLWVGSWWAGLNKLTLSSQKFGWVKHHPGNKNSIPNTSIRSFAEDKDKNLWLSTREGGLVKWNKNSNQFTIIPHYPGTGENWSPHMVSSILIDSKSRLWVGTTRNGLYFIDEENRIYRHYKKANNEELTPSTLIHENINAIKEDHAGNIWVSSRGGGIFKISGSGDIIRRFYNDSKDNSEIPSNNFSSNSIHVDSKGFLWFGTEDMGAVRINPSSHEVLNFNSKESERRISHNLITAIAEDNEGSIWLATYGNGIDKLFRKHGRWRVENYNMNNSLLPSNGIDGLVVDRQNNLWISSVGYISRLVPSNDSVNNFSVFDGALPGEYFNGSQFMSSDGTIFFGGIGGFSYFTPKDLHFENLPPDIFLTDFSLFNSAVAVSDNSTILSETVNNTQSITLDHKQNVFAFEFTTLDYLEPERNKYAYRMLGFSDEWIETGHDNRRATFTNLDSGNYTFQIIASNKDGQWNKKGREISIKVLAAPWKSWWAYTVYLLFSCTAVTYFVYQRYKVLEAKTKQQAAEASNEAKSNFLATMSHEIRTPINGVLGAASLLSECRLSDEGSNYVRTIKVSAENLLYIVNDILDLSKIEAGAIVLESHIFNLRECIENSLDLFTNELDQKEVELLLIADDDVPCFVKSDSTRIRQIIVNLVGNAIKFTNKGNVTVLLEHIQGIDKTHKIKFRVVDTGEGISEEKQRHIFEAFTQADESTTRTHGGTGLGLTISQRLVKIFGGKISIKSKIGEGTEFYFTVELEEANDFISINHVAASPSASGKKITFIDCDSQLQRFTNSIGQITRCQIEYAELNANTIKNLLRKRRPDAIIINIKRFENSHLFLLEKINEKEELRNIPVILMTPPGVYHFKSDAISKIFDQVLFKPLRLGDLASQLEKVFNRRHIEKTDRPHENSLLAQDYPMDILLADDNAVTQKVLLYTFRKLGYEPDIVSNGFEILSSIKSKPYDLLISDLQMPGMDGLEATEILRKDYSERELIIAISSAEVSQNLDDLLNNRVVQGIITKPVSMSALKDFLINSYHNIQSFKNSVD